MKGPRIDSLGRIILDVPHTSSRHVWKVDDGEVIEYYKQRFQRVTIFGYRYPQLRWTQVPSKSYTADGSYGTMTRDEVPAPPAIGENKVATFTDYTETAGVPAPADIELVLHGQHHVKVCFNRACTLLAINGEREAFHTFCAGAGPMTLSQWRALYDVFVRQQDADDLFDTQQDTRYAGCP